MKDHIPLTHGLTARSLAQDKNFLRAASAWFFICILLALGIYARCVDLSWHFSNNDDLRTFRAILEGPKHVPRIFTIPEGYTNAPFQFIYTTFLISKDQNYRELLFWGRLPSCVMSILALFAMVYFYRRWEGKDKAGVFLGLSLMAFSWENIVYAKQTYSYAVGVLAMTLMLGLLAEYVRREKLSLLRVMILSFGLAMTSNMQYQVHLFIPPFFLVIFLSQWNCRQDKARWAFHFMLGVLFYAALMFPTWYFFMWDKLHKGADSINTQTAPFVAAKGSWWQGLAGMSRFFIENLFLVFQTKTGFAPENSIVFKILRYFLYSLFLLGIFRCMIKRGERKGYLLIFFSVSLALWWLLTAVHKVSFGVSRHTLILLPLFCVMVTEGFSFALERFRVPLRAKTGIALVISVCFAVIFLFYFNQFRRERRDPTDERELMRVFQKYSPDVIIYNSETFGLKEMKYLQDYLRGYLIHRNWRDPRTVVWISRYKPGDFLIKNCDDIRRQYNRKFNSGNDVYLPHSCKDYRMVYSKVMPSSVQTDFSRTYQNEMYSNSYYFYIFQLKQIPRAEPPPGTKGV